MTPKEDPRSPRFLPRRRLLSGGAALGCGLPLGCRPPQAPGATPARIQIEPSFENHLGPSFLLIAVDLWVEDRLIGQFRADPQRGDARHGGEVVRFSRHDRSSLRSEARIKASFQGFGYGVFSYLKDYRFEARSAFSLEPRGPTSSWLLVALCHEKGGPTTPLEQRPHIDWRFEPA